MRPEFASLKAKRSKVLGKLRDDSWVTIRACNFGSSSEGMYAMYAFFGGKANVYCPIEFQFFGDPPIAPGMRHETRLEVHEHLIRQHFRPKDVHTLKRKNAYVSDIVDKGKFSAPFEIARMRMEDPPPDQVTAYEPLIDQLNGRSVPAPLRAVFEANGFTLPPKPAVAVKSKNKRWTITDKRFRHENTTVTVSYDVFESVEFDDRNRQVAVLRAGASIDDKPSTQESVPIQLFLTEGQNDGFRGKVLRLAGYTDDRRAREPLSPTRRASTPCGRCSSRAASALARSTSRPIWRARRTSIWRPGRSPSSSRPPDRPMPSASPGPSATANTASRSCSSTR